MTTISYSAAVDRFSRAQKGLKSIGHLSVGEQRCLNGAEDNRKYILFEGKTVLETGSLEDVVRWCREGGALAANEVIAA